MEALTIRCSRCGRDLPEEAFSPSQRKPGRWCRKCHTEDQQNKRWDPAKPRITDVCLNCGKDITDRRRDTQYCSTSCSMKAFRKRNPGHSRWYVLKCVYGIDQAAYDALMLRQGGKCALCKCELVEDLPKSSLRQINIDHDHETGAVRGLLCSSCNVGLGFLGDTVERLRAAIAYIENPPGWPLGVKVGETGETGECGEFGEFGEFAFGHEKSRPVGRL